MSEMDLPHENIVYGEGDDEALPEDLYYRDITTKLTALHDGDDDIENLHQHIPDSIPQPRQRPEIIPEPHYERHDPSDTLYGANTNNYTTDDNITYPNPALAPTNGDKKKGSCGDDCGCDEAKVEVKKTKGSCGDSCGCDDAAADDDDESSKKTNNSGSCGSDDCGCDSTPKSTNTTSDGVQSFGNYADILKPGQNPENNTAPIKASTVGADYDQSGISNIPALGSVWIKTWGCSHNTSDGEYMAGLLSQAGYTITNDENAAQIWICNSCSVKGPSEQSFFNELKRGRSLGKGVVVAGCVPQAHPNHPQLATFSGKAKAMSGMQIKKLKRQKMLLEQQRPEMLQSGKTDAEIDAHIEEEQKKLKEELTARHKKDTEAMINQGITVPTGGGEDGEEETPYAGVVSVLGTDNIHRVVEVVEATLQGNSLSFLSNPQRHRPANDLALPKIRKNPFVEIISINTGCLNNCTYCKTKHARGNLRSYPINEIVERVRTSLEEGVIEIWLTSEDLGAYGIDIGVRVHHLVDEILKIMTPGTMIRMGMSNPPYFKDILEPMYGIFKHPACYEFLHIPVQAGADPVLNEMRRDYTNFEFQTICDELLKNVPTLTLATDFICGFPTETDDDWKHSVALVEKYKFPVVFINQFYPRPGTPAYALPQLPAATLKARSKELVTLFNSYNTRAGREGEEWEVLVTDMSRDGDFMVAHTKRYDQVLIAAHPAIMGKKVKVKITQAEKHYFHAELCPGAIEQANAVKTILPANYKYWQFAKYIDSNLANFTEPINTNPIVTTTASPSIILPVKKSAGKSNTGGIDDDEEDELAKLGTKKRTTVTAATIATTTTVTSTPPSSTIPVPTTPSTPLPPVSTQPMKKQETTLTTTSPDLSSKPSNTSTPLYQHTTNSDQERLKVVMAVILALIAILAIRRF